MDFPLSSIFNQYKQRNIICRYQRLRQPLRMTAPLLPKSNYQLSSCYFDGTVNTIHTHARYPVDILVLVVYSISKCWTCCLWSSSSPDSASILTNIHNAMASTCNCTWIHSKLQKLWDMLSAPHEKYRTGSVVEYFYWERRSKYRQPLFRNHDVPYW